MHPIHKKLRRVLAALGLAALAAAAPLQQALAYTGTMGSVSAATASFTMPYTDTITPVSSFITAAFTSGALPKFSATQNQPTVNDVFAAANHNLYWKTSADCSADAKTAISPLDAIVPVGAWCWESSDQDAGRTAAASDWMPQGVSSTREAAVGGYTGTDGVVVSWYRPDPLSPDPQAPAATGARLTFVNLPATNATATYRRVILVKPQVVGGKLTISDVPTHAGSVTWYGNYIYVSSAALIRVFDIRHIYSLYAGNSTSIGPDASGHLNAYGYPYAMFQVAEFSTGCVVGSSVSAIGSNLCTSGGAIDWTNDRFVTFEHRATAAMTGSAVGARIVSWPMDASGTTKGLLTRVSGAATSSGTVYTTPTPNLQGVVRNGNDVYMSRSAPTSSGTIYHTSTPAGAAVHTTTPWMPNAEAIAYTTATVSGVVRGRLWSVNETMGRRWLLWVYTDDLQ